MTETLEETTFALAKRLGIPTTKMDILEDGLRAERERSVQHADAVGATMFELTADQNKQAFNWVRSHPCTVTEHGAIGGAITYTFTPTSIGHIKKATCACGAELDLTDYELW